MVSSVSQAQALLKMANIRIQQARFEQALELLTRVYQINSTLDDGDIDSNVLNSMANVYYATGQFEQAQRYYSELVALDEAAGNHASLAVSLFNLGHVNASRNLYREANANFQRSLTLSRKLGDESGGAYSLKALGVTAHAQRDLDSAQAYLLEALHGFQSVDDQQQTATVHRHLGDIAREELRLEAAVSHYEQALPALAASSSNEALMRTYRGLSSAYEQLQEYEKAFTGHRAYTQLLQQHLEQRNRQTTQRMQAQFETQRLTSDNERLELLNQSQRQELQHRQELLQLQYLVLALALGIVLSFAVLWLRSRQHAVRMQTLATTDGLTGLMNRRAIMQFGENEWQRYLRLKRPFCCLIIDIDHFKSINDTWGHGVGDQVLKNVSTATKAALRQLDALGRMGGEEFLVIAPESSAQQAEVLAERIRQGLACLAHEDMNERTVTVSIGIAQISEESSLEELIGRADQALYKAKDEGRNQVRTFQAIGTEENSHLRFSASAANR